MIEAGIDEVTMILLPVSELLNSPDRRWYDIANEMVFEAEDKLNLLDLFGERKYMNKAISGYSVGYTYGHHDFFFTVCYHHIWARMGVLIKFSAQALAYYQGQTNLMPYEILQQMRSPLYQVRCSRIDIAVDFIEEGIDINEIYTGYLNEQIKVFVIRERNGRIEHTEKSYKIQVICSEGDCETVYFGKRDSPVMLRIYNKKTEQINNRGSRYSEAVQYNDWVRFELEAKHDYAHKLTTALLDTKNDIEYKEIILDFIIQKYFFVTANNNAPAPFLQQLIDMKNNQEITLFKSVNTKNTELSKNLLHLLRTSGTVTTLYKINAIWGNAGLKKCMDTITEIIKTHQPNQDCVRFLRNNLEEYRIAYSDYDSFFESEILPELLDE
ncbi:replication initiation factor domain-containing protein [Ruminococcus difficilis]|uniref:Replication initiation factor domain-containing protein n=1 Tax=Ruminococcus difficilis TaxID=2763069 RepID=A0A934WU52_9FIRM|nr:replication initiation factor domain-containing protein [Ruminococcus difficilis]